MSINLESEGLNASNGFWRWVDYCAEVLNKTAAVTPFISALAGIHLNIYAAIKAGLIDEHPPVTRALKVTIAITLVIVNIIRLIISISFVGFILTGIVAVERLWDVLCAISTRLFSIFSDDNERISANGILAEKSHLLALTAISFFGLILLATPFSWVGMVILAGVSVYSFLDAIDKNPLRWLANKILNHPFSLKDVKPKELHVNDRCYINAVTLPTKHILEGLNIKPTIRNDSEFVSMHARKKEVNFNGVVFDSRDKMRRPGYNNALSNSLAKH